MAKGFGGVFTAAVIIGAAAAGLAYVMQYKKAHEELDKDLKEFDNESSSNDSQETVLEGCSECGDDYDEFEFEEEVQVKSASEKNEDRKYVSLNRSKEQFVSAAKATWEQAKEMAEPAKATWEKAKEMAAPAVDLAKDAAKVVSEKVSDAGAVAAEKFEGVKDEAYNTFGDARDIAEKGFATAKDTAYVAKEKAMNRFYEFREQQTVSEPDEETETEPEPFISEEE